MGLANVHSMGGVADPEIVTIATQLNSGPTHDSTHDLALSVVLSIFKDPVRIYSLGTARIMGSLELNRRLSFSFLASLNIDRTRHHE